MEEKKNNKKVIFISIILISILISGVTFAFWVINLNNTSVAFTINNVVFTYDAGTDIISNNMMPVTNKEEGIVKNINVRVNDNNPATFNLFLKINSIDAGLTNDDSLKYAVYSGDTQLTIGSFKDLSAESADIELLTNRTVTNSISTYRLYLWLDGNIDNNPSILEKTFSFSIYGEGTGANIVEPFILSKDTSGANAPSIDTAYMVPVYYDSTSLNWKIADIYNLNDQWHNYTDKRWANMVLVGASASSCTPGTNCLDSVTKHDRAFYTNQSNVGQPVSMDDILAFYVWIPRYKYKVWNINKIIRNTQAYTYNAYNDGIDIQWESGTNSTGNVSCTYYYTAPVADAGSPNETCTVTGDTSNPYYTHPAFTFGSDELTGIWVGKFETSSNTHLTGDAYGGGNVTSLTARIVPNVTSWRYINIGNMFTVLQNMHNASNEYGLPTTKTNVDSHMMKNTEWGAVAYLTNSIYGKCTGLPGGCTEVQINSHWDNSDGGTSYSTYYTTKTGCGPSADGATGKYNTACTEYNTTTGMLASTTGNITGVYDMSGGAREYVMGNMSSVTGAYTFYPNNTSSTMPVSWYTSTTSKYVDTYAYDSSNYEGQIAYNRSRLGDATGEVNITGSAGSGGWYSDYAYFVVSSSSWFVRGGFFGDGSGAGPFGFDYIYGGAYYSFSFRASLVPLGAA